MEQHQGIKTLSPFISNLFNVLKKSNLELYLRNKYHEIKEIQNILYDNKGLNNILVTPKHGKKEY